MDERNFFIAPILGACYLAPILGARCLSLRVTNNLFFINIWRYRNESQHNGVEEHYISSHSLINCCGFILPTNAEEVSETVETEQPKLICETIEACQTLSESLQAQIDVLEKKGVENLSDDEFVHYAQLADELIATERLETQYTENLVAIEKAETEKNAKTIATLNQKQEQMRHAQKQEITKLKNMLLGQ